MPLMDTGVFYILRNRPSNNSNLKSIKRNLKNAYTVYMPLNKKRSYENGVIVGRKLANAFYKYVNKKSNVNTSTPFKRGLKKGITKSTLYWLPGIAARGVHSNVNRFVKRAGKMRGLENVHRLFNNSN